MGGFAGVNEDSGTIRYSFSTGTPNGNFDEGGHTGWDNDGNGNKVRDSYWDVNELGTTSKGKDSGVDTTEGLETSEMTGSAAKSNMNLDFSSVWNTVSGDYPELKFEK